MKHYRLLTTRQRHAGLPDETLKGIESLLASSNSRGDKGVVQLGKNISRFLKGESQVVSAGDTFDLAHCGKIYPAIVCFDETLGLHAVRRYLQDRFDQELLKRDTPTDRIKPLLLLTIGDVEELSTLGKSLSVEEVFSAYAEHLESEVNDYTGSFSHFVKFKYGASIDWLASLPFQKHNEILRGLIARQSGTTEVRVEVAR